MARYWSASKGKWFELPKMNYAHLLNAFRRDPENQDLYNEIKSRMSGKKSNGTLVAGSDYDTANVNILPGRPPIVKVVLEEGQIRGLTEDKQTGFLFNTKEPWVIRWRPE